MKQATSSTIVVVWCVVSRNTKQALYIREKSRRDVEVTRNITPRIMQ